MIFKNKRIDNDKYNRSMKKKKYEGNMNFAKNKK